MKFKNEVHLPVLFAFAFSFNPKLMKKVDECAADKSAHGSLIYVIKQWHLPAGLDSHKGLKTPAPQAKNQEQIYNQLNEWVQKSTGLKALVAEGCEGDVNAKMKEAFQGWTFEDLQSKKGDLNYSTLLAHPVVMIKVAHPEVNAVCGDNLAEIKKSQLALSDARADAGYISRLAEHQDKPKALKPYLDDVISLYHLPAQASILDAQKALLGDLKTSVAGFQTSTHLRDLAFAEKLNALADHPEKLVRDLVLVIGGMHANDLKTVLEGKHLNCVILEPLAYQNDEEALSSRLQALIQ